MKHELLLSVFMRALAATVAVAPLANAAENPFITDEEETEAQAAACAKEAQPKAGSPLKADTSGFEKAIVARFGSGSTEAAQARELLETARQELESKHRGAFAAKVWFTALNPKAPVEGTENVALIERCELVKYVSLGEFTTIAELKERVAELLSSVNEGAESEIIADEPTENEEAEAAATTWGKKLVYPVMNTKISSPFGYRKHPVLGKKILHAGVDLRSKYGNPIYASLRGTVEAAGFMGSCGKGVIIRHTPSVTTNYCHMSKIRAKKGQAVENNTWIGDTGSTGRSTGPHVHLGLKLSGVYKNPAPYLVKRTGTSAKQSCESQTELGDPGKRCCSKDVQAKYFLDRPTPWCSEKGLVQVKGCDLSGGRGRGMVWDCLDN